MIKLKRIFKNYEETGSLNEQVNLYGFVDSHMFLTKTGDPGVVVEVRGVDYECLDETTLDSLTKRLESAFKLFDDNYRIYQYLFKRNNKTIPYKLYAEVPRDQKGYSADFRGDSMQFTSRLLGTSELVRKPGPAAAWAPAPAGMLNSFSPLFFAV